MNVPWKRLPSESKSSPSNGIIDIFKMSMIDQCFIEKKQNFWKIFRSLKIQNKPFDYFIVRLTRMWLVTVEEITDKLFETMNNFLLWSSPDIKHLSSISTYHSACQIHLLANKRLAFGLTDNLKTNHAMVTCYCMNYIIIIIVHLSILDNQPWKSYRMQLF